MERQRDACVRKVMEHTKKVIGGRFIYTDVDKGQGFSTSADIRIAWRAFKKHRCPWPFLL